MYFNSSRYFLRYYFPSPFSRLNISYFIFSLTFVMYLSLSLFFIFSYSPFLTLPRKIQPPPPISLPSFRAPLPVSHSFVVRSLVFHLTTPLTSLPFNPRNLYHFFTHPSDPSSFTPFPIYFILVPPPRFRSLFFFFHPTPLHPFVFSPSLALSLAQPPLLLLRLLPRWPTARVLGLQVRRRYNCYVAC